MHRADGEDEVADAVLIDARRQPREAEQRQREVAEVVAREREGVERALLEGRDAARQRLLVRHGRPRGERQHGALSLGGGHGLGDGFGRVVGGDARHVGAEHLERGRVLRHHFRLELLRFLDVVDVLLLRDNGKETRSGDRLRRAGSRHPSGPGRNARLEAGLSQRVLQTSPKLQYGGGGRDRQAPAFSPNFGLGDVTCFLLLLLRCTHLLLIGAGGVATEHHHRTMRSDHAPFPSCAESIRSGELAKLITKRCEKQDTWELPVGVESFEDEPEEDAPDEDVPLKDTPLTKESVALLLFSVKLTLLAPLGLASASRCSEGRGEAIGDAMDGPEVRWSRNSSELASFDQPNRPLLEKTRVVSVSRENDFYPKVNFRKL